MTGNVARNIRFWTGVWGDAACTAGRPGMRIDPVTRARTGKLAVGATRRDMAQQAEDVD
jgi:hypothetical protein